MTRLALLVASAGNIYESMDGTGITPLPATVTDRALENFIEAKTKIDPLWSGTNPEPIPIPRRPGKAYYDRFALDFSRTYFYKNLLKCFLSVEILRPHLTEFDDFVDLGCGSGAFSIALLSAFPTSNALMIDYSLSQLRIATQLITALGMQDRCNISYNNLIGLDLVNKNFVASYAVAEMMRENINVLRMIDEASSLIILDDLFVVRNVKSHLRLSAYNLLSRYVEFRAAHTLQGVEGGGGRFSLLYKSALTSPGT